MSQQCRIDNSILVKLATGEPAWDFDHVVAALTHLVEVEHVALFAGHMDQVDAAIEAGALNRSGPAGYGLVHWLGELGRVHAKRDDAVPIRADIAVHDARGRRNAATRRRVLDRAVFVFGAGSTLEHIGHGIEVMPMQLIFCREGLFNRMPSDAGDLRQGLFLGREMAFGLGESHVGLRWVKGG